MTIKQSVINTFNRIGIDYKSLAELDQKVEVANWITGARVWTKPLIRTCIDWVYKKQLDFERGDMGCRLDDFDRVRYFILEQDQNAYYTCID